MAKIMPNSSHSRTMRSRRPIARASWISWAVKAGPRSRSDVRAGRCHRPMTLRPLHEGVLEAAPGESRPADRADHVDEGAQRRRDLPAPGIIEEETLEEWRPVFQHADQLARAQEWIGQRFQRVRDSQPVNGRANGQIGIVNDHPAFRRNPTRLAIALDRPFEYGTVHRQAILNAAVASEIVGRARRTPQREVCRRADHGNLHRSHYSNGNQA